MESTPANATTHVSVLRMAAPLVVSFWMRAAVTFVDTIYASLIGDASVAAVGLTLPLEFLMIAVWVGLSSGLTSRLSLAMGAGDHTKVDQYLRAGWTMVWSVSPLFTVVGAAIWLVAPHLSLEQETARSFQVYGTVLIGGSAFTTFWSVIPDSLVKAHQDTRSTMWAGIWTNAINFGLNTLFLFVFDWGVLGIALSTVLARIGGLAYALARARWHETRRKAEAGTATGAPDPNPYQAILSLAVPSALTFSLMALEGGLVNGLLARLPHATEAIAAYAIYYRVVLFSLQPVIAASVALLPYAARRIGAGDWAGARRGLREVSLGAALYSVIFVGPVMLLTASWIAGRLSESAITARYTAFALRTVPLTCLAGALFLLCRPVFEAMQRGRPGLVMAILRYLVLTGPLAWLGMRVAARLGQPELFGLIAGTLAAAALASAIFYAWLRSVLDAGTARLQAVVYGGR